MGKRMIGWLVE